MVQLEEQTAELTKLGKLVRLYALHGENWTCRMEPADINTEGEYVRVKVVLAPTTEEVEVKLQVIAALEIVIGAELDP
jgi:hypothetical protein